MLAQVYGLTPAEQRVLDGMLQGLSAKEIAECHGVSFHTVRSQMKGLFGKTEVNRYGELVRLAAQGGMLAGDT
jgi:DNA-binding CsgD family transcriptional regulator